MVNLTEKNFGGMHETLHIDTPDEKSKASQQTQEMPEFLICAFATSTMF